MKTWKRAGITASAALLIAGLAAPPATAATTDAESPGITPAEAQFAENRDLSPDQIRERTIELTDAYTEVGDVLSDVDAEFVQIYAPAEEGPAPGEISPMFETYTPFDASAEDNGERGTISGNMSLFTKAGTWENNYKGTINAAGSAGITSIETCFRVRAYGTVGETGVGVVFSEDPCTTVQGRSAQYSVNQNYSGFVISATMTADARFFRANGSSFQVTSTL